LPFEWDMSCVIEFNYQCRKSIHWCQDYDAHFNPKNVYKHYVYKMLLFLDLFEFNYYIYVFIKLTPTPISCFIKTWYINILLITLYKNVTTLVLGSRPKQGCGPRKEVQEWKKVWANEPSHSQGSFHLGSWSLGGLPNVHRAIARAKTQWIEELFISLKSYWNVNV